MRVVSLWADVTKAQNVFSADGSFLPFIDGRNSVGIVKEPEQDLGITKSSKISQAGDAACKIVV